MATTVTQKRRVMVTGLAAISPLGLTAEATWEGLIAGRSGIGPITAFDTQGLPSRIGGEIKGFDPELYIEPREVKKYDRYIHLAVAGARMGLESAGLKPGDFDPDRAGIVIGSGIGGWPWMEKTLYQVFHAMHQEPDRPDKALKKISPFFIPGVIVNLAGGLAAILNQFRGPNLSPVTACASGNHSIGEAMRIIQYGDADLMLAGGSESTICQLAFAGFSTMRALSTRNEEPERASRPFDRDRDGFVLSEGCGLLVLEAEEHARARGAKPLVELAGYGMSCDAYHVSAPPEDGDGMVRVMRAVLRDAGLAPEEVDYVNAHGTSTPTGDVIEARAVRTVFGPGSKAPLMSSTKSMTGHMLGAAGGVEAVATVLAVARDLVPPTINLDNPDPGIDLDCVPHQARPATVRAALSNSFGFGGTNASLIFRKV